MLVCCNHLFLRIEHNSDVLAGSFLSPDISSVPVHSFYVSFYDSFSSCFPPLFLCVRPVFLSDLCRVLPCVVYVKDTHVVIGCVNTQWENAEQEKRKNDINMEKNTDIKDEWIVLWEGTYEHVGDAVLVDGVIVWLVTRRQLICINLSDGEEIREFELPKVDELNKNREWDAVKIARVMENKLIISLNSQNSTENFIFDICKQYFLKSADRNLLLFESILFYPGNGQIFSSFDGVTVEDVPPIPLTYSLIDEVLSLYKSESELLISWDHVHSAVFNESSGVFMIQQAESGSNSKSFVFESIAFDSDDDVLRMVPLSAIVFGSMDRRLEGNSTPFLFSLLKNIESRVLDVKNEVAELMQQNKKLDAMAIKGAKLLFEKINIDDSVPFIVSSVSYAFALESKRLYFVADLIFSEFDVFFV